MTSASLVATNSELDGQRTGGQRTRQSSVGGSLGDRRILAVVLPQFLVELALDVVMASTVKNSRVPKPKLSSLALGVVVTDGGEGQRLQPTGTGWLPGMGEAVAKVELLPKTRIDAVSQRAQQFGVRSGQTIAEARALLSELQICELPKERVRAALVSIAESLSKFASIVSFEAGGHTRSGANTSVRSARGNVARNKSKPSDQKSNRNAGTLWLDITGIGHLYGGEQELAHEVVSTVRALGHRVRVAVAGGPVLAQAFACWPAQDQTVQNQAVQVLSNEEIKAAVRWLPITALPVDVATQTWLARLGVLTFADLEKIPRNVAAHRLGEAHAASRILDLLQGKDDTPLRPHVPQALPVESLQWDDPVNGREPLLFALRGLVAKVCARLDGRGLAARRLRVMVLGDRAISNFRGVKPDLCMDFELVSPLYRAEELWKVLSPRLSQARLSAPSTGLRLEVLELTPRGERQLSLVSADSKLDGSTPEKMAVLFGGLAAEIGVHAFGRLQLVDSHRPELQSVLTQVGSLQGAEPRSAAAHRRGHPMNTTKAGLRVVQGILPGLGGTPSNDVASSDNAAPTRLVTPPLALPEPPEREPGTPDARTPDARTPNARTPDARTPDARTPNARTPNARAFAVGEAFTVEGQRYRVEQVEFVHRIDGVEWWAEQPTSRDYYRLWLVNPAGGAIDAFVFVDRATGKRHLQGFYD
jgi:protein ImuB